MRLAVLTAAVVLTASTFATVPPAHASELDFSYTLDTGNVLSGVLDGTLLSDGNTFDVTSLSSLSVNGATVATSASINSADFIYLNIDDTAAVSLNGSFMDLYATANDGNAFALAAGDQLSTQEGGNLEGASSGYGGNNSLNLDYSPADWSASIVGPTAATPEPSTFVFLGTGLLGLAGAVRRKFIR